MDVLSKINSTSGAEFKERPTVGGAPVALDAEVKAVEKKLDNFMFTTSVGSLFKADANNQYEGWRIKILSDAEGNVKKVVTGKYNAEGEWVDETGIKAGIVGMEWNTSTNSFDPPQPIAYKDSDEIIATNSFNDDQIAPWCNIKYVEKVETINGKSITQCLAACPKFWYTGVQIPANTITLPGSSSVLSDKTFIQVVSSVPLKSFEVFGITVPEAQVYEEFKKADGTEMDWVYDNVYRISAIDINTGLPVSCSNGKSVMSDSNNTFTGHVLASYPYTCETSIVTGKAATGFSRNMNDKLGISQRTYNAGTWQQYYRMKLLYRIEFNTINSQSVMNDWTSGSARAASSTKDFIDASIAAGVPLVGTMNYKKKSSTDCTIKMADGCYYNPIIYRYHAELFGSPGTILGNVLQTPYQTDGSYNESACKIYFGNCRSCTFNWNCSGDVSSCFSNYVSYYDAYNYPSCMSGFVKAEAWEKDGILSYPKSSIGSYDYDKGYGDHYLLNVDWNQSSGPVFSPVAVGDTGSSRGRSGASYFFGGNIGVWSGRVFGLSAGLSVHFC